jgi:protein-S-isoprenylcysteine O-methyltransferase Ste14
VAPLPHTNSGAAVAFYVALGIFGLLELRVRLRSLLNRQGSRSDRGSFALLYIAITTAIAAAFVLAGSVHGAAIRFARWPFFVAGVVLMAAGIGFRQWAVAVLGRFFTTDVRVHRDQLVVETGPYRWVRHPSYTGLLMTLVGVGLALGNWASLAVLVVVPAAGLVVRIRVEERVLLDGLGEPYRRYAEGRARLIPGVW